MVTETYKNMDYNGYNRNRDQDDVSISSLTVNLHEKESNVDSR